MRGLLEKFSEMWALIDVYVPAKLLILCGKTNLIQINKIEIVYRLASNEVKRQTELKIQSILYQ